MNSSVILFAILSVVFIVVESRPQGAGRDDTSNFELNEDETPVKEAKSIDNSYNNYVPDEQDKTAKYSYSQDIEDKINDLSIKQGVTRNGLSTEGFYSYSDGFYKRTVHYIADENGYRITKQSSERLDGPVINKNGTAKVNTVLPGGQVIKYGIRAVTVNCEDSEMADFEKCKTL